MRRITSLDSTLIFIFALRNENGFECKIKAFLSYILYLSAKNVLINLSKSVTVFVVFSLIMIFNFKIQDGGEI